MSVKLMNKKSDTTRTLKDGQIAVIVDMVSAYYPENVGKIVQRVGSQLILIGCGLGGSFATYFSTKNCIEGFTFRVLKNGEQLTITDNE